MPACKKPLDDPAPTTLTERETLTVHSGDQRGVMPEATPVPDVKIAPGGLKHSMPQATPMPMPGVKKNTSRVETLYAIGSSTSARCQNNGDSRAPVGLRHCMVCQNDIWQNHIW